MKEFLSYLKIKENIPIWLAITSIVVLHALAGCFTQRIMEYNKSRIQTERYFSPFRFNYYPATLILETGDTIKGRFTKNKTQFNLLHENPDSNYHCDKKEVNAVTEDYYFKKFQAPELKKYIVNGQSYIPVYIINKKTSPSFKKDAMFYDFMIRLTPDSLSMQLYKNLEMDEDRSLLSQWLFPPDTTINNYDYNLRYYLHFPDEDLQVVWRIDTRLSENKRLKQRMTEMLTGCPALSETLRNIQQLSNNDYFLRVLALPDSTIKTKGMQALMERIQLFDTCFTKIK